MKNKVLILLCLISFVSCSQDNETSKKVEKPINKVKPEPHKYGGWYCPDNLNGFPAVNIANWETVPVVNGRMATKEETQSEKALIFVDPKKYPDARPLKIKMPQLARYYNQSSKREELIIIIQALNIQNDSIVGFRYLNGGNGSARLKEVEFLSKNDIEMIPKSKFVSYDIKINAPQDAVWEVLTDPQHSSTLQYFFDQGNKLNKNWRKESNINYHYQNCGDLTASYANKLYGNFYIQNDYNHFKYNEKFLLLDNKDTKKLELKIVCGPYNHDYEIQKSVLIAWAQKVKELSEKNNLFKP